MSKICESWNLEDLVAMGDEEMETLLDYYKSGDVPSFEEIHDSFDPNEHVFDGSFGWW